MNAVARAARAVTVCLGALVMALYAAYATARAPIARHQVESIALAFVVVGVATHVLIGPATGLQTVLRRRSRWGWLPWCAGSLLLYSPILGIGLLSDDFVLVELARRGEFGSVHAEFFRPIPLGAWAGIWHVVPTPIALHVVSVTAHGLVAFLVTRLAVPMLSSRLLAVAAGMIVLTFPASVEAVAWISGVFDVSATLLALLAVESGRRYVGAPGPSTRAAMMLAAVSSLLCKETGIVVPALIALDAWALRHWTRRLRIDMAVLTAAFIAVGVVRVVLASDIVHQPIVKYTIQRWLFGTIGGLTTPWHEQVVASSPWLPLAGVATTIVLFTTFFVTRSDARTKRLAVATSGWLLLGAAPTLTFFFVAGDLQGSRYLYLPVTGYALLIGIVAESAFRRSWVGAWLIAGLAALGAAGVSSHQRCWQEAALARDAVISAAATDVRMRSCPAISLSGLPDSVRGAYVFRNGAREAFADAGLTLIDRAPPSCTFAWDTTRAVFTIAP